MRNTPRSVLLVVVSVLSLAGLVEAEQPLVSTSRDSAAAGVEVLSPAWEIGAREEIAAREYWVTWQDRTQLEDLPAAWHAPNRAQGLRIYFTPTGIHVVPRTSPEPAWTWGLSLVRYGRGKDSHAVEQAKLFPDENRVRLDRREIEEWFVNEPRGLKHGFVLHAPPGSGHASMGSGRPVHLDLIVSGNLTPALESDGRSVHFAGPSGLGTIYYRGLEVQDAEGRALPSRMELFLESGDWVVRLVADDAGAVYPLTIDPLTTTAAWIAEIDQEGAKFGDSVGFAGDINDDGYDDVIVGAIFFDNGYVSEGAAFLYLGSAAGPSLVKDWTIEGGALGIFAGYPVGTAGDVNGDGYDDAIVGASGFDNGDGVWVFHGSPAGLASVPDWVGHCDQPSNQGFGRAAGTAGDVNGDGYDDVIVGAKSYETPGYTQDGRAFVFYGSASGLSVEPDWFTSGLQNNSAYGCAVGTAGDVNADGYDDVIVGAYWYDNGQTYEGRAYVYYGSASGLSLVADWIFENDVTLSCLGWSVGTAGDVNGDGYDDVIVGSPNNACDNTPASLGGKAYTFYGSDSGLSVDPDWTSELVQTGAVYGVRVATAGDVNDDGYDDVLVGTWLYDNDEVNEGGVFLYLGSETGLTLETAWMAEGNQDGAYFGTGLAGAGDVDGDGIDDVVVGASKYDNGEDNEGRAFLYLGTGSTAPAGWVPADVPLGVSMNHGVALDLSWAPSCLATDIDYEVYEGQIGDFTSHKPRLCSTGGQTSVTFIPDSGSTYYLVVPRSQSSEGSYGKTSAGSERPTGTPACLVQVIGGC